MLELLKEAMVSKLSDTKCFLIDGYPREMEQGTRFENEVKRNPYVVHFTKAKREKSTHTKFYSILIRF